MSFLDGTSSLDFRPRLYNELVYLVRTSAAFDRTCHNWRYCHSLIAHDAADAFLPLHLEAGAFDAVLQPISAVHPSGVGNRPTTTYLLDIVN
jgi:hypothetical protein